MKTNDLITLLASNATPVAPHSSERRFQQALGLGALGGFVIFLAGYGINPDWAQAAWLPMFWIKLIFAGSLAALALPLAMRLSQPGIPLGWAAKMWGLPILGMALLGASVVLQAAPEARASLVLGASWQSCSFNIALIASPALLALLWAMHGLAPTRPMVAGACAGLLAGALATLLYALHCPEMSAPFIAIWYTIGMSLPTLAGAALGHWFLRW